MSKSEKRRIDSIVGKAERVIGRCQPSVDLVYPDILKGKLEMVWSDNSHNSSPYIFHTESHQCIMVMLADNVRRLNWED